MNHDDRADQISKLDAARRQLEIAIFLFFQDADPVAVHTLAAAARGLLGDLAKARGLRGHLDAAIQEVVRPERREEVQALLRQAQNFFKHADRDAEGLLEFHPAVNDLFLWDASYLYQAVANQVTAVLLTIRVWVALERPGLISSPEHQRTVGAMGKTFDTNNKAMFFREMLAYASEFVSGQGSTGTALS
jgi:hypothetical protein